MSKKEQENFLEKIPQRVDRFKWTSDENGIVTIEMENRGFMKRATQILLKKPLTSYIHLDENGSFIWNLIDGKTNLIDIGTRVEEHFGDACQPLYERLSQFIKSLETFGFITLS